MGPIQNPFSFPYMDPTWVSHMWPIFQPTYSDTDPIFGSWNLCTHAVWVTTKAELDIMCRNQAQIHRFNLKSNGLR